MHEAPEAQPTTARAAPARRSRVRASLRRPSLWIPTLLLVSVASTYVPFLLPATTDQIAESYEPLKTLKFFAHKGQLVHKWGPLPAFVYGPLYAPALALWYARGELRSPSEDFPYGLLRPQEQLGTLIFAARAVTLLIAGAALLVLTGALARSAASEWIAGTAVLVLGVTPEVARAVACTKPDGLMLAFLVLALAVYARIVDRGLTRRSGILLTVLAVASISCKELTLPVLALMIGALLPFGLVTTRTAPEVRRRFVRDYAFAIGAGLLAYALVNVVYAPGTYLERLQIVFGPLKSPSIWAAPDLSEADYLEQSLRSVVAVLGYPGTLLVAVALAGTCVWRPPAWPMLWLPFLGHVAAMIATAGYMPVYFMLPVGILATLPVTVTTAAALRRWQDRSGWSARTGLAAVLLLAAWSVGGVAAGTWRRMQAADQVLIERYLNEHVATSTPLCVARLHRRNPGESRLHWLGFNEDDRALGELLIPGASLPDLVLLSRELSVWLGQFEERPARTELLRQETGFDYRRFESMEALGYHRVAEVRPLQLPGWAAILTPDVNPDAAMWVYRR